MKYKIAIIVLSAVMLMTATAVLYESTDEVSAMQHGDLIYELINEGTEVRITGYDDSGGNVNIPSTIDDKNVVEIGRYAFILSPLTSITIPDSVEIIDDFAFYGCNDLTTASIGNSVTYVGDLAFYGCSSLTSIIIPDSVGTIGKSAFSSCYGLTTISIGSGVTNIGNNAFHWCPELLSINVDNGNTKYSSEDGALYEWSTLIKCPEGKSGSFTIPDGVTAIGNEAFYRCDSLTSIIIPDSVVSIGVGAFIFDRALTSINVNEDNPNYADIDGVLYDKNFSTLIKCPEVRSGSFIIPDGVTTIGDSAFSYCDALISITMPEGLTAINNNAFSFCMDLTSITIPDGVTTIGDSAFDGCYSSTSVTIPDSVTTIGDFGFSYCTSLTSITIPEGVTVIGGYVFYKCISLTSVTMHDGVTSIGYNAFDSCTSLTSITIPDGVTTIGDSAFDSCTSLTSITIPDGVTTIGDSAFDSCTSLTSITIPDGVTTIGDSAFNECSSLMSINVNYGNLNYADIDGVLYTKDLSTLIQCPGGKSGSITISDKVTQIESSAFKGCSYLTSINVDDNNFSYASVGGILYTKDLSTLLQCPGGKSGSITIPDGVTFIGGNAFKGCSSLTLINVDDNNLIYADIDGVLYNKDCSTLIKYPGAKRGSFVIPDSVTSIGRSAFEGCSYLTSISMPDSVTYIGESAFEGCSSLRYITIPDSVTQIGRYVFTDCYSLTYIKVDEDNSNYFSVDGILYRGENILIQCPPGKSGNVTIGEDSVSIGSYAFEGCSSLRSITFSSDVIIIDDYAFKGCSSLTSMEFSGNAPIIKPGCFQGCDNLTVYYAPDSTGFTTPTWKNVACYPIQEDSGNELVVTFGMVVAIVIVAAGSIMLLRRR